MSETTGRKVAGIAGRVLRILESSFTADDKDRGVWVYPPPAPMTRGMVGKQVCSIKDLKALAASALTQAPDKSPARNRKRGSK